MSMPKQPEWINAHNFDVCDTAGVLNGLQKLYPAASFKKGWVAHSAVTRLLRLVQPRNGHPITIL